MQTYALQKLSKILYKLQAAMTESEAIQTVAMQVAIKASTTAVIVVWEADAELTSGTNAVN